MSGLMVYLALTVSQVAPPAPPPVPAPAPPVFTRVLLTELHCMGCAKKIAGKVSAVPGVSEMRVDLKARTIFAIHKPGMTPSPAGLWEAIEQADHEPEKMETPSGTHTSKPKP